MISEFIQCSLPLSRSRVVGRSVALLESGGLLGALVRMMGMPGMMECWRSVRRKGLVTRAQLKEEKIFWGTHKADYLITVEFLKGSTGPLCNLFYSSDKSIKNRIA